jgi:hypothetical protein
MKSMTSVIAGLLLAGAGAANAAQPITLSEAQMDSVSAGATAISTAAAAALGAITAQTGATTATTTVGNVLATATGASTAIAVTVNPLFGPAVAVSGSASGASLP